jgi:hypothetical protein
MRFWKRLRWIATIAFIALLLASRLGAGSSTVHRDTPAARPAPAIPN